MPRGVKNKNEKSGIYTETFFRKAERKVVTLYSISKFVLKSWPKGLFGARFGWFFQPQKCRPAD
jgi:hypothetical protein